MIESENTNQYFIILLSFSLKFLIINLKQYNSVTNQILWLSILVVIS